MTHAPVLLLLDALAVYRLTQLIVHDTLLAPVRVWLIGSRETDNRLLSGERVKVAARPWIADLLGCSWCVSFWLAIGVVLMQSLIPGPWLYVSAALAFSAVAGLLAERG